MCVYVVIIFSTLVIHSPSSDDESRFFGAFLAIFFEQLRLDHVCTHPHVWYAATLLICEVATIALACRFASLSSGRRSTAWRKSRRRRFLPSRTSRALQRLCRPSSLLLASPSSPSAAVCTPPSCVFDQLQHAVLVALLLLSTTTPWCCFAPPSLLTTGTNVPSSSPPGTVTREISGAANPCGLSTRAMSTPAVCAAVQQCLRHVFAAAP